MTWDFGSQGRGFKSPQVRFILSESLFDELFHLLLFISLIFSRPSHLNVQRAVLNPEPIRTKPATAADSKIFSLVAPVLMACFLWPLVHWSHLTATAHARAIKLLYFIDNAPSLSISDAGFLNAESTSSPRASVNRLGCVFAHHNSFFNRCFLK